MTEQVHRAEVVRGRVEVQEWVGLGWDEWAALVQAQVLVENASALNAEL